MNVFVSFYIGFSSIITDNPKKESQTYWYLLKGKTIFLFVVILEFLKQILSW